MKNALYIFILSLISTISVHAQQISYQWSTGDTTASFSANPTVTTTYYVTVNQYGINYVDSITIQVNTPSYASFNETACDSFTWAVNNQTYTSSGNYIDTLTNAAGCDSIITLNLVVNQSNSGSESIIACDSYTWPANSQTYTTSGAYSVTLTNAGGCDSIATLILTIHNSVLVPIDTLGVEQFTWSNGITYTTSGVYYDTLATIFGCDSIVELTLTIVPSLNLDICSTDSAICVGTPVTLSVKVSQAVASPSELEIGYYYEGGIIAYIFQPSDFGYVAGETHGIIIAENDLSTKLTWGPWYNGTIHQALFYSLSTGIGRGGLNTQRILFVADSLGVNYPAAQAADSYVAGCFDDWILPSELDLVQIRSNLALNGIGNFNTTPIPSQYETGYWSSSFMSNFAGARAPFMNVSGGTCGCAVFESYWVRPVRYF